MSGGYFNYENYKIDEIADQVERLINAAEKGASGDESDATEWEKDLFANGSTELKAALRDASICLLKAACYAKRLDWLLAGDDGEETFLKKLNEQLKNIDDLKKETH
jgi:hypothetical protein